MTNWFERLDPGRKVVILAFVALVVFVLMLMLEGCCRLPSNPM